MHVRQLTQAEAVGAGGVREAVDGDGRAVRLHLEALAHLLVQLEVGDRTPEVGRCKQNTHDDSVYVRTKLKEAEYMYLRLWFMMLT